MSAFQPCAFGGGPLVGTKLMKVVYLDETGHDAKQTVAAVAGVLIDPDRQWLALAERIKLLRLEVPDEYRDGFIFHATDLHYGSKRPNWPRDEQRQLLNRLIELPRLLGIPIVLGVWRKVHERGPAQQESIVVHALAYGFCLKAADWYMSTLAPPDEVAMVVAEERPEAHKAIRASHALLSDEATIRKWLPPFVLRDFPISRIKAPPAFASKDEEILLQMADACAFVFQRFINGGDGHEKLVDAMFGEHAHPMALSKLKTDSIPWTCFWWPGEGEAPASHGAEAS